MEQEHPSNKQVIVDIVERFTLTLMLCFVGFRNLIELSGSAFDFSEGVFLPKSFGFFKGGLGGGVLWTITYVCPVITSGSYVAIFAVDFVL